MIITYQKDSEAPKQISGMQALVFFRAFRGELWLSGTYRDPQTGDSVLGVTILSMTI